MPIGFSDLLKTTAQLDNNLTKGIVSTDDTFGGIRSKIDDWTDLHTSTYNGGSGYTYQDDGTGAAPGHFKAYSTMFYVADGRALVETNTASGAIRLNSSGEFVANGGQLYTHGAGTAEPEYWVLSDPTQVGGSGSGTDKLPKFTITGTPGSGSTALPAGYQKLQVLTNAAPSDGAVSLSSDLDNNLLSNTSGELGLDNQNANAVFAGPGAGGAAAPTFRALVSADIPNNAANTTGSAGTLTTGRTFKVDLASTSVSTAFNGSANIHDVGVTGVLPQANGGTGLTSISTLLNSNVTATSLGLVIGTDVQAFDAQLSDIAGLTPTDSHFIVGDGTNFITESGGTARTSLGLGTIATQNANSVAITGGSIDGTAIGATTAAAGAFTTVTASSNVTISGNLTVAGDVVQQNSTTVVFNDTFLDLNVANSASTYVTDSGFRFARKTSAANELSENAALTYDADVDLFKFTRHGDSATGAVASADNVAALKFTKSDAVSQTNQADDLATMPDDDFANVASVRSLGAVAKCSITITNQTNDSGSNFAPDIQGTNGYVIKHNLNTTSVYVVAIKDPSGTATPVFCKYSPIDANIVRVTVGVTTDGEVYDIIVIG